MSKSSHFLLKLISLPLAVYGLYSVFTSDNPGKAMAELIMWSAIIGAINLIQPIAYLVSGGELKKLEMPANTTPETADKINKIRKGLALFGLIVAFLVSLLIAVLAYFMGTSVK